MCHSVGNKQIGDESGREQPGASVKQGLPWSLLRPRGDLGSDDNPRARGTRRGGSLQHRADRRVSLSWQRLVHRISHTDARMFDCGATGRSLSARARARTSCAAAFCASSTCACSFSSCASSSCSTIGLASVGARRAAARAPVRSAARSAARALQEPERADVARSRPDESELGGRARVRSRAGFARRPRAPHATAPSEGSRGVPQASAQDAGGHRIIAQASAELCELVPRRWGAVRRRRRRGRSKSTCTP